MLWNGVMPMPPAKRIADFAEFLCSVNEPYGPSTSTSRPGAPSSSVRLKALPVRRVANVSLGSSDGDDTIENVRAEPFSSWYVGWGIVRSQDWPGSKLKGS